VPQTPDYAEPVIGRAFARPVGSIRATIALLRAVVLGVMATCFGMMFFGVAGMTVGAVGVVRRLFVIAGFVMLGGFAVMLGRVLVMFGSLVMMVLDACVVVHVCSPGSAMKREPGLRRRFDTMLTASRQLCCS
jgi:hypothetical protein